MVILIHIIAFILLFIAGVSKAVMDKLNFHYSKSIFSSYGSLFWNIPESSNNKYKYGLKEYGPRFFGSTTFLVWTTDARHFFQMIYGISFAIAFALLGMFSNWWIVILGYVFSRGVFEIFFKEVFTRKFKR